MKITKTLDIFVEKIEIEKEIACEVKVAYTNGRLKITVKDKND